MNSRRTYSFLAFFLIFGLLFFSPTTIKSASDHVLISEVQISGTSVSDEFVELYNPTGIDMDLSSWRLTRASSTGVESNLVASLSGTIKSGGYFLVAHADYNGSVLPDLPYSTSNNISSNGAVSLYSDAGVTLVDRVGFGSSILFEGVSVENPSSDQSVERIPVDEDTDNNLNDFVLREVSDPQNLSTVSTTPSPTPTPEPTATPTETPEPTATASPSPTVSPTPLPTIAPSPVATPRVLARFGNLECRLKFTLQRFGFMLVIYPKLECIHLDN